MNVSSSSEPRRYLIAIGSPHCPNMELHSLAQVQTDIKRVVKLFTSKEQGYERVLADQIGLGSTASKIKDALSGWFSSPERKASDCIIVYYAGHGGEEGNFGSHYLFTVESDANNLSSTAIETGSLVKCFFEGAGERSANILLILDVCYAGQGVKQLIDTLSQRQKEIKGSGFWVIASVDSHTQAADGAFVDALEAVMQNLDWIPSQEEFLNPSHLTTAINNYLKEECTKKKEAILKSEVTCLSSSGSIVFVRNPKFKPQKSSQSILFNTNGFSTEYQDMQEAVDRISNEEFYKRLSDYSNYLPPSMKRQSINDIAFYAWESVVENPRLAAKLSEDEKLKEKEIWHLLFPLCKIASEEYLLSHELYKFFELREKNEELIEFNRGERGYERLLKMIIRFVLYNQSSLLNSNESLLIIRKLAERQELHWREFFADIYLRHVCNTIVIPEILLDLISSISTDYIKQNQEQSLPQVWEFIVNPLIVNSKIKEDKITAKEIIHTIKITAGKCKNFIDFKWCMAALHRIVPLFDISEAELKLFEQIPEIIELVPQTVRSKCPQIQSILLESLLKAFIYTRNKKYLQDYEEKFKNIYDKLFTSNKSQLQLEYACCLYIFCQFQYYDDISELSFGKMINNRMNLTNEPLFNNERINMKDLQKLIDNKFELDNIGSIYKFLFAYIDSLYQEYAQLIIEINHNNLRNFPALCRIYDLFKKRQIAGKILKSLKIAIEPEVKRPPSFYALSMQSFKYIPRNKNVDLIQKYIEKSLEADDYSIVRSAKDIAWALYTCYYYYDNKKLKKANEVEHKKHRDHIIFLLDYFAEIAGINESNLPKFHWAYYAGIKWDKKPAEENFINELFNNVSNPKNLDVPKFKNVNGAEFSNKMGYIIKKYSSMPDNSIFARLLNSDTINPETWNIIGTTILNNRKEGDIPALWKSAYCYALAKCFAREQKNYDQKYWYNYIYSMAKALKEGKYKPPQFYIIDTIDYLSMSQAQFFNYKKDRLTDFFELVQQYWNQMEEDARSQLLRTKKRKWIYDELLKDEKFEKLRKALYKN